MAIMVHVERRSNYPPFITRAARVVGENLLKPPERLAVPRYGPIINFLTVLPPADIEEFVPGFSEGTYFRRIFEQNPSAWIPSPALRSSIQFAGESDEEGLSQKTRREVYALGETFAESHKGYVGEHFDPAAVIQGLDFASEMVEGMQRRTGERWGAHFDRVVLRGIERIHTQMEMRRRGISTVSVFPDSATAFLLLLGLHDVGEDEFHLDEEEARRLVFELGLEMPETPSQKYLAANVFAQQRSAKGDGENGLLLRKHIRWQEDPNTWCEVPLKEAHIPLGPLRSTYTVAALDALNSARVGNDFARHLIEVTGEMMGDLPTDWNANGAFLAYMPVFAKDIDREDNLAAYMYRLIHGEIVNTSPEKIIDKAQESMNEFAAIEQNLISAVARPGIMNDLFDAMRHNNIPKAFYLFRIIHKSGITQNLPSRWAKLTLLGVTPDRMYQGRSPFGLPVSI